MTPETETKIKQVKALIAKGTRVGVACKEVGINQWSYYQGLKRLPKRRKPREPELITIPLSGLPSSRSYVILCDLETALKHLRKLNHE